MHDLANPICVAREVHAPMVDRVGERHSIRQQRRPRFEIKPYLELGICTIGRDGDAAAMAQVMMVTSEGWLHPSVQTIEAGGAFHAELTSCVVRMLAPDEEDA